MLKNVQWAQLPSYSLPLTPKEIKILLTNPKPFGSMFKSFGFPKKVKK
jgi:hypothetical protein